MKLSPSPSISRLITRLAKISKFSEQQVLDDLCIGGVEETTELYEQIRAFRKGGESKQDVSKPEGPKHLEEEKVPHGTIPAAEQFAAGPVGNDDHGAFSVEPDMGAVERALASLGDLEERPRQLAANPADPGDNDSPSDDDNGRSL